VTSTMRFTDRPASFWRFKSLAIHHPLQVGFLFLYLPRHHIPIHDCTACKSCFMFASCNRQTTARACTRMVGRPKEARRAGWAPRQPCTSGFGVSTITILIIAPLSRAQQIRTIHRRRQCPRRTRKQRAAAVGVASICRRRRMHCARLPSGR